eukprot:6412855-Pyramimonas_sp.AAC.1
MPVIVVTILAFIVASIFMAIVEMIIDTTMIAFCEDCDSNDGHPAATVTKKPPAAQPRVDVAWNVRLFYRGAVPYRCTI